MEKENESPLTFLDDVITIEFTYPVNYPHRMYVLKKEDIISLHTHTCISYEFIRFQYL